MDWTSLFGNSRIGQDLAQYPDARLYKAASMLAPEERPNVPVRTHDGVGRNVMMLPPDRKQILVNQNSKRMKQPEVLAAKLAHERVHLDREDQDEIPAYEKELEVLRRLAKRRTEDILATQEFVDSLKRNRSMGK